MYKTFAKLLVRRTLVRGIGKSGNDEENFFAVDVVERLISINVESIIVLINNYLLSILSIIL